MLTTTSLRHPTIRCKIHGAMIRAAAQSRVHSFGSTRISKTLRVEHYRQGSLDLWLESRSGFKFVEHIGNDRWKNVTKTVLAALRS